MCLSLSGGKKFPGNLQLQPGNPLSPIGPGPSTLKHTQLSTHRVPSTWASRQNGRSWSGFTRTFCIWRYVKVREFDDWDGGTTIVREHLWAWKHLKLATRNFKEAFFRLRVGVGGCNRKFPWFSKYVTFGIDSGTPLLAPSLEMKTSYQKGVCLGNPRVIASILFFSCWALLEDH